MKLRTLPGREKPPLSHTWRVGKATVTLILNRNADGSFSSHCDWDPPRTRWPKGPRIQAQWTAGLQVAVAKFRAATGQAIDP